MEITTVCTIALLVIFTLHIKVGITSDYVVVKTLSGKIKGRTINIRNKSINRFRGIPYAVAPVGEKRFRPPEPIKPWDEIDALHPPNSCIQKVDKTFGSFEGSEMWNPNTQMSEDCLKLNIWAPKQGTNLSVMVWVYGGSFNAGTSTLDLYDPSYLVAYNNVIFVSFNYRLGPFGFLYLNNENAPGNVGLLDQQSALRWVYENIESFGGNPNNICLFGESAGAASVSLHLLSQNSWPYFNNAILQSGAIGAHWSFQTKNEALDRAKKLAAEVNCGSSKISNIIECLRKVDPKYLADNQYVVSMNNSYFDISFGPTVDGYFLQDYPQNLIRERKLKTANILVGVTENEGSYFLLYGIPDVFPNSNDVYQNVTRDEFVRSIKSILVPVKGNNILRESFISNYYENIIPIDRPSYRSVIEEIASDVSIKCPVIKFSRMYSQSGSNVYLYNFNHRSSFNPWPRYAGVMHGYEIDFVFGQPFNGSHSYSKKEIDLSQRVMQLWTNFAKSGQPDDEAAWPSYNVYIQSYLDIKVGRSEIQRGLRHRQCTFIYDMMSRLSDLDNVQCSSRAFRTEIFNSITCLLIIISSPIILIATGHV